MASTPPRRSLTPKSCPPSASSENGSTGGKRPTSSKKSRPIPKTVPKPFNLTVQGRIEERQQFDKQRQQRQAEFEDHEKVREAKREQEDAEELQKYRKSLDFKANPIRKYNNIVISPSEKELTVPEAPSLSVLSRRRDHSAMADSEGSSGADSASPAGSNGASRPRDDHFVRIL